MQESKRLTSTLLQEKPKDTDRKRERKKDKEKWQIQDSFSLFRSQC